MEQVITETSSDIVMEIKPFGNKSDIVITFKDRCYGLFHTTTEWLSKVLNDELCWSSEKIDGILPPPCSLETLVTAEEFRTLNYLINEERIRETEGVTATSFGMKMMVGIKKDALKEQSHYDVIGEILKESPLIESVNFLNFWN